MRIGEAVARATDDVDRMESNDSPRGRLATFRRLAPPFGDILASIDVECLNGLAKSGCKRLRTMNREASVRPRSCAPRQPEMVSPPGTPAPGAKMPNVVDLLW